MVEFSNSALPDLVPLAELARLIGRPDDYFRLRRRILAGTLAGGYYRGRLCVSRVVAKRLLAAQRAFTEAESPDDLTPAA